MFDRELIDALDALTPINFNGTLWRTAWKNRDPLQGGSAGGRWSEPNGSETLYTSLEADVSLAELYYQLSIAPVFSSRIVQLFEIRASDLKVLDLGDVEQIRKLGINDPMATGSQDLEQTRALGAVADFLENQGIIVPSVRAEGLNLVLFPGRLDLNKSLVIQKVSDINWSAWREKNK